MRDEWEARKSPGIHTLPVISYQITKILRPLLVLSVASNFSNYIAIIIHPRARNFAFSIDRLSSALKAFPCR